MGQYQTSNFRRLLKFIDTLCCLIFTISSNELMSHLCHHCVSLVWCYCVQEMVLLTMIHFCHFSNLSFNFVMYLENESSANAWPMVAR